jgi:hypothetical protein
MVLSMCVALICAVRGLAYESIASQKETTAMQNEPIDDERWRSGFLASCASPDVRAVRLLRGVYGSLCRALPESYHDELQDREPQTCVQALWWRRNKTSSMDSNHRLPIIHPRPNGKDRGSGSSFTRFAACHESIRAVRRRLGSFGTTTTSREAQRPCRACTPIRLLSQT